METSLGLSQDTCSQAEEMPNIGGMVQGKADVLQLSMQQSEVLLKVHKQLTTGFSLLNPTGTRRVSHHSISFADDTDQHTNVDTRMDDVIPTVVENL